MDDQVESLRPESKPQPSIDTNFQNEIMPPEEIAQYLRKSLSWIYKNWKILGARKLGGSLIFPKRRTYMSTYFKKGKGWRYHFILEGTRYTKAWFKTKREAREAEVIRREEINNPKSEREIPIDMAFLELVNRRLDHVEAYNSATHYRDYCCMAKKWIKKWGNMPCSQVSQERIQQFILERNKVSAYTANKNLRALRATFNFGKKRKFILNNPTDGIDFLPEDKKIKYVPSQEDIKKLIAVADSDTQDYLCTIRETMARVNEINRLTWNDIDFNARYVIFYTRKKKGGHLTPRKVPMTKKLHEILFRRYSQRDKSKP